jgi:hypothetical protein
MGQKQSKGRLTLLQSFLLAVEVPFVLEGLLVKPMDIPELRARLHRAENNGRLL